MNRYSFDDKLKNIICEQAEDQIRRKIKDGISKEDAINQTKDEMELEEDEISSVTDNLDDSTVETPSFSPVKQNAIFFNTPDELNQAVGMLMYKSIPWDSKGIDDSPYICFSSSDDTDRAKEVLKRKYDFLDNQERNVASVQFDNLADYDKVLKFMLKSGMKMNFVPSEEFDEDGITEDGIKTKNKEPITRSYKAEPKEKMDELAVKPEKNRLYRNTFVRKRWN